MPGLVGVMALSLEPQERARVTEILPSLLAPLRHQPGYATETYLDPRQGLAVARLHLGILNPAPQPYASPEAPVKVFLHGEIYNDNVPSDRQLDYIGQLYTRVGPTFPAHLNGSFLVLLHDASRSLLLLATDRTASKPLFYALHRNYLYFAPELKALAHLPTLPKTLNLTALASFLSAGYFLNGHTLLDAVRLLDNATILQLTPTGLTTQRYWHYTFEEGAKDRGMAYYHHTLADLLRTAVQRRLRTPHRYGLLLSGGYDSRALLGFALAQPPAHPLHTISWGVSPSLPHSDCAIAARLAHRLGLPHTFYPLRPHTLPAHLRHFIDLSDGRTDACTNYPEALAIFQHMRHTLGLHILLRGDECFGWLSGARDETTMFHTLGIYPLQAWKPYQSVLRREYEALLAEAYSQLLHQISARCDARNIHNRKDFFYLDQRLKYYLHPLNYIKTIEVEIRTPYLDNDILDFMKEVPYWYRIEKRLFRKTVTHLFPDLFHEVACQSDAINWMAVLRESEPLRAFFAKEFEQLPSALEHLFEVSGMQRALAASVNSAQQRRFKGLAIMLLGRHPSIYQTAKQTYKDLTKVLRPHTPTAPMTAVVFRLLTLKIWADQFFSDVPEVPTHGTPPYVGPSHTEMICQG